MFKSAEVKDGQADESWNFVAVKGKERKRQKIDNPKAGDTFTFVGFERESKLELTWHLGRRYNPNTDAFAEKLAKATTGQF